MDECIDFFNRYVMGSIQMLTGAYFLAAFLQKKMKLYFYLLFAVLCFVIIKVVPDGRIIEFLVYILLLMACGIFMHTGTNTKNHIWQFFVWNTASGADGCPARRVGEETFPARFLHTDWKSVILYAALTVEIMQLCYGIVNSLFSILYPLMISFDQKIVGIAFMLLGNMVSLLLSVFCYRMVYRYFIHSETMKKQYVLMILTPILMLFLMDEYINAVIYGSADITNGSGIIIYANHYQLFAIQLLGMASLFCILFVYKKLLQNFQLNTELSLLEQEEHSLNRYVEEAKARYEKTKSFRHDIKNHITVVRELLQNGKSEQALDYIVDMEDVTEELSFPCSTNNPVVDILMGNKLGIAKSMGIDVSCSLCLPYPCSVRDIDFGIILSNALDNAIHACKNMDNDAEKYIRVTGHVQGDFVLLEIENSFQGKRAFKKGTGLSNVNTVADKYHGAMSIKTQGTSFVLSVLLIIPQHSEDISLQID